MLTAIHIVISVCLIAAILLQERSAGLSGIFGESGGFYQTRRGVEKFLFGGTIGLAIAFALLAILTLVY